MTCTLCSLVLPPNAIEDAHLSFCCHGCHAVYRILSTAGQLNAEFSQHPVFLQAVDSGLIANPDLLNQIREKKTDIFEEKNKLHLEIQEMWCPSCAEVIRLILLRKNGVVRCLVDYATDLAVIEYNPKKISQEEIKKIITSLGYRPQPLQDVETRKISRKMLFRFVIAAFFALNVMMLAYPLYATYWDLGSKEYTPLFAWLSMVASLPVLTYCAWPIYKRFIVSCRVRLFGMETLVVMGLISAGILSVIGLSDGSYHVYFDSMAVIIAFVLLGKIIETKAKFSSKESLLRLVKTLPRRGRKRFSDGSEVFVPVKELCIGDIVVAYTGEKIVVDGIVEDGEGACDESLISGESIPLVKKKGDKVISGAIVKQGMVLYRVNAPSDDSTLSRILSMITTDLEKKSPYVRPVDRIIPWFVPLVIMLAILTALLSETQPWLRAIAVLLISCPCAIGIAAPLAESSLIQALGEMGVVIRNRGCLSWLGKETIFAFDKTGTITEGRFQVLEGLENLTSKQKQILKTMAMRSIHPISLAISEALNVMSLAGEKTLEIPGKGIKGEFGLEIYYLGSESFFRELGINVQHPLNKETTVYFGNSENIFTMICLGDKVRGDAAMTIGNFNVKSILLSGDSIGVVKKVAEECGFKEWHAEQSPLSKWEKIDQWTKQGEIVAMLGDGINDAPALTAAKVGISVVSAADISIQVSDILLTNDQLSILPEIRRLAIRGRRIINQNLFWAFFYNVLGIGLAATGYLTPVYAAAAMAVSSIIVTLNAQRIKN